MGIRILERTYVSSGECFSNSNFLKSYKQTQCLKQINFFLLKDAITSKGISTSVIVGIFSMFPVIIGPFSCHWYSDLSFYRIRNASVAWKFILTGTNLLVFSWFDQGAPWTYLQTRVPASDVLLMYSVVTPTTTFGQNTQTSYFVKLKFLPSAVRNTQSLIRYWYTIKSIGLQLRLSHNNIMD